MSKQPEKSHQNLHESERLLRQALADLVRLTEGLSGLNDLEPGRVAEYVADFVIQTLNVDLVAIAYQPVPDREEFWLDRTKQPGNNPEQSQEVKEVLAQRFQGHEVDGVQLIPFSFHASPLRCVRIPFKESAGSGMFVVCSQREDFPTEINGLLLEGCAQHLSLACQKYRAEVNLQHEHDRLSVTLESIGDAVITTDPLGKITFLNAVAQLLTGWTAKEAIGLPLSHVFRIINEHTRLPVANPIEKVLREGTVVGLANHTLLIAKDGTECPIDDSAAPIRDVSGQMIGTVLVFRDVTQQKIAERALHESEERYRLIGEVANDAIWDWDLVTNQVIWNQGVQSRFGYRVEEIVPDASWWVNHIHPNDRERIVHSIHDVIDGGGEFWLDEYRFLNADGTSSDVLDRGRVLRDDAARPLRMIGSMLDLSERKSAERTIREQEERYRTLFESIDEGYCIIEMIFDAKDRPIDYLFVEVNKAFEEHTGLRDALGKRMRELIPNHDDSWFEIYGKVAKTGEPIRFTNEAKILQRWFDLYAFRIGPPESNQVAVIFNNITDRIEGEAERERLLKLVDIERERLNDVFQRAPSFMCVTRGPSHVYERANHQYLSLIGHREVVGRTVAEVLPEIKGQGFIELLDQVYASGEAFRGMDMRVELQTAPDQPHDVRYVDFVYQALRNSEGEITGILTQGVDLTDRKRAEAALRENEQRFSEIISQVEDYAIFLTDDQGRPISWNEGVRQVLGFEEKEFLGIEITSTIFTEEDIAEGIAETELQTARDLGSASDDRWMRRKDGSRFFASGVTKSLRDDSGRLSGYMKVMRDQTRRKEMEDDLRRVAADLSNASRRKDEFLATLAHELRNPLAPIRAGLELLRIAGDDRAMFESVRGSMEEQTQQLVRLVDDLLDMSRITSGKVILRKERVELATIVRSAVEATRGEAQQYGHHLAITTPSDQIFLLGDPTRLTQILSNLLTNAIRYTPPEGRLSITADREADRAVIVVSDNGLGIPHDMQERIFEMFTQVDRSIEKTSSGLGIGLTLVKRLVELHDGTIKVSSEGENKGSQFRVTLPALTESSPARGSDRPALEQAIQGSRRVLIVDDNQSAAKMLGMVVKLLGQEVRIAHDGLEAIQAAGEFRPHLVLMDLGMPRLNGYEAARQIREQDWGKEMLLVALTGWGQDEDKKRTKEAGFDHHLVKPAEPSEIKRLLMLVNPVE